MNQPEHKRVDIDTLLLLAEGELNRNERLDLFRQLDDQDGAWRTAALTLVETQMLHRQVKTIEKSLGHEQSSVDLALLNPSTLVHEKQSLGKASRNRRVGIAGLRVLAAVILFGLGIGFGQTGYFGNETPSDLERNLAGSVDSRQSDMPYPLEGISKPDQSITNAVYQTFKKFSIDDGRVLAILKIQNEDHEEFVPVMQSPTLEKQWLTASSIAPTGQALSHLNRKGWNLVRDRQFVALQLPNQHNKIVPLDVIKYEFAGPSQAY